MSQSQVWCNLCEQGSAIKQIFSELICELQNHGVNVELWFIVTLENNVQ